MPHPCWITNPTITGKAPPEGNPIPAYLRTGGWTIVLNGGYYQKYCRCSGQEECPSIASKWVLVSPKYLHNVYNGWMSEIRGLQKAGFECEMAQMNRILDLENSAHIWTPQHKNFEALLRKEKLCTVGRWKHYKQAKLMKLLPEHDIRSIGVSATCLIARQRKDKHFKLVREARDHQKKLETHPTLVSTYQHLFQLIQRQRVSVPKKPGLREEVARLTQQVAEQYTQIQKLKAKLKGYTDLVNSVKADQRKPKSR